MRSTNLNKVDFKDLLNDAIGLNRAGKHLAAIKILNKLIESHPRSAAIAGCLGGAYFELGNFEASTDYFRKAVAVSPKSETASLGLFHSLWSQNNLSQAVDEMRRFLSDSESKQYAVLLRDLVIERRLEPRPQLVGVEK